MADSAWRRRCRPLVAQALAALPAGLTRAEYAKALRPLYPWGPRQYHPYTMWLKEVNAQLDARCGAREAKARPDVTLSGGGPLCRLCLRVNGRSHPGQRCLACMPAWAQWDAVDAGLREDFLVLMMARTHRKAGADEAARDWSEEYMGGIKLEGKP